MSILLPPIKLLGNNRLAGELEPKYQKLNKMGMAGNVTTLSKLILAIFVIVTANDVTSLLGDLNCIAYRWKMFGVHIKVEDWCLKSTGKRNM